MTRLGSGVRRVAAGASLKLAQRADTLLPGMSQDRPGLLGSGDRLAAVDDRRPGRPDAFAWRGAGDRP